MTASTPSFFQRIPLAFGAFFSILGNADYAARVLGLRQAAVPAQAPAPPAAAVVAAAPAPPKEASPDAALQLLALLLVGALRYAGSQYHRSQWNKPRRSCQIYDHGKVSEWVQAWPGRACPGLNLRPPIFRPTMQFRQTDGCGYPGCRRRVADGDSPNSD